MYTSLIPWTAGFFVHLCQEEKSEEIKITSPINFSPYALYQTIPHFSIAFLEHNPTRGPYLQVY